MGRWRSLSRVNAETATAQERDEASPPPLGAGEPQAMEQMAAVRLRSARAPSVLEAPIDSLRGVGPKATEACERLGLRTLGDLIEHVPHSYRDRADAVEIAPLKLGQEATVVAEVRGRPAATNPSPRALRSSRRRSPTGAGR